MSLRSFTNYVIRKADDYLLCFKEIRCVSVCSMVCRYSKGIETGKSRNAVNNYTIAMLLSVYLA